MYKLLFILRASTLHGAGAAIYHVEFETSKEADLAYQKVKDSKSLDLTIVKLY